MTNWHFLCQVISLSIHLVKDCLLHTFFGIVVDYIAGAVFYLHCMDTLAVDVLS